MAYMDWERQGEPWYEDGFWWRYNRNGRLQWLNDRRQWKFFQNLTAAQALADAFAESGRMAKGNAMAGYQLLQWLKNSI